MALILLIDPTMRTTVTALAGVLLFAHPAAAQPADPDLANAAAHRRIVWVTDLEGRETSGVLVRADASSITVQALDGERRFDLVRSVQSVYRDGDSVKSGAMAGFVGGAVLGLVFMQSVSCGALFDPYQRCNMLETMGGMGILGGIGAGIGIGMDALHHGRTRIYPLVSRRGGGGLVSRSW